MEHSEENARRERDGCREEIELRIDERRVLHSYSDLLYGQFIEHFHNVIYGGFYDPQSPLADADGFRSDVIEALKKLRIPVIRWPGGCFASAYHWKDGIGKSREAVYDKAWCVEDSNAFGTDEFILLCQKLGAEPYICTNAGSGTPEEMADWVEYCNEPKLGKWAKKRIENGHREPFNVRYWSIGNENYTTGEIGSKRTDEWGRFVRESAKMMRRVDPKLELMAACVPELDWNLSLLREAGDLIDWISIHEYFDPAWETNLLSPYLKSLQATAKFEHDIDLTRAMLKALELDKRIKIAFDEWNLRGFYHPGIANFNALATDHEWADAEREKAEANFQYTMADAVFAASFLHVCMRNGDIVKMANFSPAITARGMLGVGRDGIVLRPTYHVFDMLRNHFGKTLIDSYAVHVPLMDADGVEVPRLDYLCSLDADRLTVSLINRDPENALKVTLSAQQRYQSAVLMTLNGASENSFNDFDRPDAVSIRETRLESTEEIVLPPHSVNLLILEKERCPVG